MIIGYASVYGKALVWEQLLLVPASDGDTSLHILSSLSLPSTWGELSCFSPPSQPCLKHYINSRVPTKELHCRSCSKPTACSRWLAAIHRLCFETASASHIPAVTQSIHETCLLQNWFRELGGWEAGPFYLL